jgi:hypothetical protein
MLSGIASPLLAESGYRSIFKSILAGASHLILDLHQFVALAHWRERGARWLCLGKMIECAKINGIFNPNVGGLCQT